MVSCLDCINSKFPTKFCMMEECMNQENNYCGGCPCNKCNCTNPEKELPLEERPNFIKK